MTDPTQPTSSAAAPAGHRVIPPGECLRCGSPIVSLGVEQFRTGGNSGKWKLLFGDLAELGEGLVALDVLACQTCGHVELRLPYTR